MPTSHEELQALVDRYLEALVRRRLEDLPLATGVAFTENGQHLPLDRGLWGTVTADPPVGRAVTVTDPESGQAGFFGAVSEHGTPALFSLRLRTEASQITEIETLVIRGHGRFELFEPGSMSTPRAHFDQLIEPSRRCSRAELIDVANRYFDGIEQNDGSIIPVRAGSIRYENGVQTVRRTSAEGGAFS